MSKWRLLLQTVSVATLASVIYGLVHDQITIRICPEYFTIWHPHVVDTNDLTVLALVWGFIATWWMGAILGTVIGASAILGRRPLPPFRCIVRWIVAILAGSAACATVTGLVFWILRINIPYAVFDSRMSATSLEVQRRFTIDLAIHNASYNASAIGAIVAGLFILRYRSKLALTSVRAQES